MTCYDWRRTLIKKHLSFALKHVEMHFKPFKLTSLVMSIAWQGPEVKDSNIYSKIKKGKNTCIMKNPKHTQIKQALMSHDTIKAWLTLHSLPRRDLRYGTSFLHSLPVLPLAPTTQVTCIKILTNSLHYTPLHSRTHNQLKCLDN